MHRIDREYKRALAIAYLIGKYLKIHNLKSKAKRMSKKSNSHHVNTNPDCRNCGRTTRETKCCWVCNNCGQRHSKRNISDATSSNEKAITNESMESKCNYSSSSSAPETAEAWKAVSRTKNGMYDSSVSMSEFASAMFEHSKKMELERNELANTLSNMPLKEL